MAALLFERGADVSFAAGGGRLIDYAIYFGNAEVAELLVAYGADDLRPAGGDWTDIEFWAEEAGAAEAVQEELGLDPWVGSGWWKNLNHLWFLWFLLWLIAGIVIIAGTADRLVGLGPYSVSEFDTDNEIERLRLALRSEDSADGGQDEHHT